MSTKPTRTPFDPTGYKGPLRFTEIMLGGKRRRGSGTWAEIEDLTAIIWDAAFASGKPLQDSHAQIAHYGRTFELFDKKDPEHKAELLERLDGIPHLADLHLDIDHDGDLERSRTEALRLVEHLLELGVQEPALGIRFSGRKGFDIAVPWTVIGVRPSGVPGLNWSTYKILAGQLAEQLDLQGVDMGLYRKNGTIRLENTVHPSSGLYKIRLTIEELRGDVESIAALASQPRKPIYDPELELEARQRVAEGLHALYLPAQIRADAHQRQVAALQQRPLDEEVLAEIGEGLTPCLKHIQESSPAKGTRNDTLFHAAMMLKHIGKAEAEARDFAHAWLGAQRGDVGADGTVRSVFSGPYAGGCRWMREAGFASDPECRACPLGQRRYNRDAREDPEGEPEIVEVPDTLPTIEQQRANLERDLETLNPYAVTVIQTPAGLGKSYAALKRTIELVEGGARVLWFVKDTLKKDGLAAGLIEELRENLNFPGKIQILYGRHEDNCDEWTLARHYQDKGYSVGKTLCPNCPARSYCGYYAQYEHIYEPGVYIAPHAMLPILFDDERRGFSKEFVTYQDPDDGRFKPIGGPLSLIVIDEDALDSTIAKSWIGSGHLDKELRERKRVVREYDSFVRGFTRREVELDPNWLTVVEWLRHAIQVQGPIIKSLESIAQHEGQSIEAMLYGINPNRIVDPDFKFNNRHKPFTTKLYRALMQEVRRLKDGNFTVWAADRGSGLNVFTVQPLQFPEGVPVIVLDAYANPEVYQRFFRVAGVSRTPVFRDYPVAEQANVTYVLGANLLKQDFDWARNGNKRAEAKISRVMRALKEITSDGIETYLIAKKDFFDSAVWRRWEPELPHCTADGDAGVLYFWRGRGINAAAGKRVAILQVPNFNPSGVLSEASVLFADEPRLDNQRTRVEEAIPWAKDAEAPRALRTDRTVYADDRLNLINERYRGDEVVQMALRSRSLTTGAEILVFADLPDPRLPARRVLTVAELVDDKTRGAQHARKIIYEALREAGALDVDTLEALGIVKGTTQAIPLRKQLKRELPEAFNVARSVPIEREIAAHEIGAQA